MRTLAALFLMSVISIGARTVSSHFSESNRIDKLRVRFSIGKNMPDPANIIWTGDWYVLGHLSSGLIHFDSTHGQFKPLLAERWEILPDYTHRFYLKKGMVFSDGSPILASDFVATIKRLLIKKSSTHFPLWEYLEGCDKLKTLRYNCPSLKAVDDSTLDIKLNGRYTSFLLQLASPETGVWSAKDIDSNTLEIKAKRYSGPYVLESFDPESSFLLKRNPSNLTSIEFPDSPERIDVRLESMDESEKMLARGDLDVFVRDYKPFAETEWSGKNVEIMRSSPSTLLYFFGVEAGSQKTKIGLDALQCLWNATSQGDDLTPAKSLLPFDRAYQLEFESMKRELPKKTSKTIRLGIPHTYYSNAFLSFIKNCFEEIGTNLDLVVLNREEYPSAFDDPKAIERVDYILTPYAASERYPAVQLRFMTGRLKHPTIDLKQAESADLSDAQIEILKDYQRWLVRDGHVIPIFFSSTLILHRKDIDLGVQEAPDSEIEFWRMTRKKP